MIIHLIKYRLQERPKYTQWPKYPGNGWNMPINLHLIIIITIFVLFLLLLFDASDFSSLLIYLARRKQIVIHTAKLSKLPQVIDN